MTKNRFTAPLFAALVAVFGLAAPPARAQEGLVDLVRIEILDGGLTKNGTQQAALRLILADGWKTYWRSPGDAGIPPKFNWGGSGNVEEITVSWPTPKVFVLSGMRSIGYDKELVLPIEITTKQPGQPVFLKGNIEFGVCQDICVPARLSFEQALDPKTGRNSMIAAALAARPFSATEAGVRSVICRLSPSADGGLVVKAEIDMPSAGGTEVTVIEPGNPQLWTSETTSSRSGNVLTTSAEVLHLTEAGFALDRSKIRFTVLGKRQAVDIIGCTSG
jgi:cytochrome c biogenesis DsbD-like protein